ncbi:camp-regulated phosphoprotein/endosulfine conserved region-domain-containing protein [Powellomyces hirtus]|nr:camp-regulated phosphoprotein/endosulfine conserved region-domain-containing protein [Powellomyces hirtus]
MAPPKQDVDVSTLGPEEKAFYEKYGRLPPAKKQILGQRMKGGDRKYFDSGDYAMSKAGKSSSNEVGSEHPSPERIPHSVPSNLKKDAGPLIESSLIHEANLKVDTPPPAPAAPGAAGPK